MNVKAMIAALCLFALPVNVFTLNFFDPIDNGGDEEELAGALVDAMSDEDALAQTFMLGWRDVADGGPSPLIQEWIQRRHVGAVKVFGWNTADTPRLARNIGIFQRLAAQNPYSTPLLVATDQEGGLVRHVKGDTNDTPGAMAIGASGFPEDAYNSGYYIGRELSVLGINMNFAPTVDLYTNHSSVLIGPRSFGDYPEYAGIMGIAFARGLLAAGVIPTAKHFPGHGDTELDSHGVLPSIDAPFDVLWNRELVPYRMMAKERIPAVMSGHIAFPNTESVGVPASLSKWFLSDVLRERIGFRGIVITDDMIMNGATSSTGSLSLAVKQAACGERHHYDEQYPGAGRSGLGEPAAGHEGGASVQGPCEGRRAPRHNCKTKTPARRGGCPAGTGHGAGTERDTGQGGGRFLSGSGGAVCHTGQRKQGFDPAYRRKGGTPLFGGSES